MNLSLLGAAVVAVMLTASGPKMYAQVAVTESATTTTTSDGTISEFAPGSDIVVTSRTASEPLRYRVTKQTTYVDETGAPITVERISRGTPVSVHYVREGDGLVADRVIVRRATTVEPAPVVRERRTTVEPAAPVVSERRTIVEPVAPAVTEHKTTTTTTTRALTHDEKERLEKQAKEEKEHAEKRRDRDEDRR